MPAKHTKRDTTDWTTHWRKNYGNFAWKTGVWRITRAYKSLLKNVNLQNPNLKILELGSGSGINSLTMAKILKAKAITLVDYNELAIDISQQVLKNAAMHIKFLNNNILYLNLTEKFDIVHSEGLIEHFYGKDRMLAFQKHVDFCKEGGFIIIFVPYKSIQYNVFKWLYARRGRWIWDEEPFSKQELYKLCKYFDLKILKEYISPLIHEIGILAKRSRD